MNLNQQEWLWQSLINTHAANAEMYGFQQVFAPTNAQIAVGRPTK